MVSRLTVTRILKVVVPALVASVLISQALSAATRSKRVPAITKPKILTKSRFATMKASLC